MANRVIKTSLKHYNEDQVSAHPGDPIAKRPVADKNKNISELSQEELWAMIERVRGERELQNIIKELKNNSGEKYPHVVDTTTPINQLYHYGIRGMRWGVRRFQNPDGSRTAAGKRREAERGDSIRSEDFRSSRSDRRKGTQALSNSDLKRLNERLELEKKYRDLSSSEKKSNETFGKSILKDVAKQSLTEVGKNLAVGLMNTLVVDKLVNKAKKG